MNDSLPQSNTPSPTGSMAKETGPHISFAETSMIAEVGQETVLPEEVSKVGVTIKPTSINLPPPVKNFGVSVVGLAAQDVAVVAPAISLPLSDEQIAQGLHQSIKSSWRWLAEWCRRQLQQAHLILKSIHGKIVRTNG